MPLQTLVVSLCPLLSSRRCNMSSLLRTPLRTLIGALYKTAIVLVGGVCIQQRWAWERMTSAVMSHSGKNGLESLFWVECEDSLEVF